MAGEVKAALHGMNHSNHGPRHAIQAEADVPIPRLMFQQLLGMPLNLVFTIVAYDYSFEPGIKLGP